MEDLIFTQGNSGAVVQKYTGHGSQLTIPDTWNGYPVTEIGAYAFSGCTSLVSVTLPSHLETIGDHAFYHCHALTCIRLAKGPRCVGNGAFMNCYALHDIYIQGMYGIRGLVMDFSNELTCHITAPDGTPFVLLFPEYDYSYEETLPRGIMSVPYGSGSFYRACVMLEKIQFADYDREFKRAVRMDSPATAQRIALYRLFYPYELRPIFRQAYIEYLTQHAAEVADAVLSARDLSFLTLLLEQNILPLDVLQDAIAQASGMDFPEGVSLLMEHRMTRFGSQKRRFTL